MPAQKEKVKKKQPRTDKRKNIGKVAEVLAKNPQATVREIAQETDMSIGAVHNSKVEVEQSWLLKKLQEEYERKQRLLPRDIKESIDTNILNDFIELCGSKTEATDRIEEFMALSLWQSKRRRKWFKENSRYAILHKYWFKCWTCWSKPLKDNDVVLHIDHIVPYSLWWLDIDNNYQVLCSLCNKSKSNWFIFNHNDER